MKQNWEENPHVKPKAINYSWSETQQHFKKMELYWPGDFCSNNPAHAIGLVCLAKCLQCIDAWKSKSRNYCS